MLILKLFLKIHTMFMHKPSVFALKKMGLVAGNNFSVQNNVYRYKSLFFN